MPGTTLQGTGSPTEPLPGEAGDMPHAIFSQPLADQPCRWCHHYDGIAWGEPDMAFCVRDRAHDGRRRVAARAHEGCVFWEREPGADDDWGDVAERHPRPGDGPWGGSHTIALRLERAARAPVPVAVSMHRLAAAPLEHATA